MKSVCLHGPESTGKTTLARELAARFQTVWIPEYGRLYCEIFGNDCDLEDLRAIRRGHDLFSTAARRKAKTLAIFDTDAVMTAIWAEVLLGSRDAVLDRIDDTADLYLLCDIDIAWENDGVRYGGLAAPEARRRFFDLCRDELVRRDLPYVTIRGDHQMRFDTAVDAVLAHFPELLHI
jgi:HTH-type transcriptional regulator, transcriptional repressor of NAD biosynthesis genes